MYAYCVEGKKVILHIIMYNVMSDFSGARQISEGRVLMQLIYQKLALLTQCHMS